VVVVILEATRVGRPAVGVTAEASEVVHREVAAAVRAVEADSVAADTMEVENWTPQEARQW
jgi:hypothetical protein